MGLTGGDKGGQRSSLFRRTAAATAAVIRMRHPKADKEAASTSRIPDSVVAALQLEPAMREELHMVLIEQYMRKVAPEFTSRFTYGQVTDLAHRCTYRHYEPGEVVCEPSDPVRFFFLVLQACAFGKPHPQLVQHPRPFGFPPPPLPPIGRVASGSSRSISHTRRGPNGRGWLKLVGAALTETRGVGAAR